MPGPEYFFKVDRRAVEAIGTSKSIEKGLLVLAQVGETKAKELAPVDTGNLRRSITSGLGQDSRSSYSYFGTNVFYGIYQELGTRYHPAHPYLRPALEYVRKFLRDWEGTE